MWILETAAVALGLYSALPVPQFEWTRRNMRYALAAFPLVGVLLGLACWAWSALCAFLSLPALLRGAVLCVLPALVSGGIHLDGYCDTADALASHASPERMREILHDPHCGAFAVTRLCVYFITLFALCCVWVPTRTGLVCLGLSFVLSRTLSGAALTLLTSPRAPAWRAASPTPQTKTGCAASSRSRRRSACWGRRWLAVGEPWPQSAP